MRKLEGKVAFITGAARGQGRTHAVTLAREGAGILAVDICAPIESVPYPLATEADMAATVSDVEAIGGRIYSATADVRDVGALQKAFDAGLDELGPVDIVIANAGIAPMVGHPVRANYNLPAEEAIAWLTGAREPASTWKDAIDVNLTGAFNTVQVAVPSMIARAEGGSIVITSSMAGMLGIGGPSRGSLAYTASKHGVVGLMRTYANNLAPYNIRVNSVHPAGVRTPMLTNDVSRNHFNSLPAAQADVMSNALSVRHLDPEDVSNAVLWLVSNDARYVTGIQLPVDAGYANKR